MPSHIGGTLPGILNHPAEALGSESQKLHKDIFTVIHLVKYELMRARAKRLPIGDPRRNAFFEASSCKVALSLLSALPSNNNKFSNAEWFSAVQNKFGVSQSSCRYHAGSPIRNHSNCLNSFVDVFGYNLKTVSGVKGDGIRHLHDKIVDVISGWLRRASLPHKGGLHGTPQVASGVFANQMALTSNSSDEATKLRQGIIPDIIILLSAKHQPVEFTDTRDIMIDVKTLGPGTSYNIGSPDKARDNKQTRVKQSYLSTAKRLDKMLGTTAGQEGPVEKQLKTFASGNVFGHIVGAYGGISKEFEGMLSTLAAHIARDYCTTWDVNPMYATSLIKHQMHQELGLCVHKGWARLLLDRVQNNTYAAAAPPAAQDNLNNDPDFCAKAMREHLESAPDTRVSRAGAGTNF